MVAASPTSPSPSLEATGPLPLPPQAGGEGKISRLTGRSGAGPKLMLVLALALLGGEAAGLAAQFEP